jgi:hypothetical protein
VGSSSPSTSCALECTQTNPCRSIKRQVLVFTSHSCARLSCAPSSCALSTMDGGAHQPCPSPPWLFGNKKHATRIRPAMQVDLEISDLRRGRSHPPSELLYRPAKSKLADDPQGTRWGIEAISWGDELVSACTQVHYHKAVSSLRKSGFFSHPLRHSVLLHLQRPETDLRTAEFPGNSSLIPSHSR